MYCYLVIGCAPKNGSKNVNLPPVTKKFVGSVETTMCCISLFLFFHESKGSSLRTHLDMDDPLG